MRRAGLVGACWPDDIQQAVLCAAALEPRAAARAWQGLRSTIDVQGLQDADLHRLLPAVYRNLRDAGVDDPDLPLLKGLYRRAFYANRVLLHRTVPALELLQDARIEPIVLKGLPLAVQYAHDLALRPMGDIDIVVPMADAQRAVDVLAQHGWVHTDRITPAQLTRLRPGVNCTGPEGGQLDLHWRLRRSAPPPGSAGRDDLEGLTLVELALPEGPTVRTLGATDHLLYTIQHGVRIDSDARVRWAFDVAMILRTAGDQIDAEHLLARARDQGSVLVLRNALAYLVGALQIELPDDLFAAVARAPVGRRERRVFMVASGARPSISPWRLWVSSSADWSRRQTVVGFPRFLRDSWGLRSTAQVPIAAVVRAGRKIRRADAVGARAHA